MDSCNYDLFINNLVEGKWANCGFSCGVNDTFTYHEWWFSASSGVGNAFINNIIQGFRNAGIAVSNQKDVLISGNQILGIFKSENVYVILSNNCEGNSKIKNNNIF